MLALNSSILPIKSFGVEMQDVVAAWLPLPLADEARHGNSSTPQSHSSSSESRSKSTTPELKFVTLTGPPSSRSKESRLVVRSHAMQAFLREKKNDGRMPRKKEPDSQVKKLDEALGRFKLASWSRKSTKKAPAVAKGKKSPDRGNDHQTKESEVPKSVDMVLSPVSQPKAAHVVKRRANMVIAGRFGSARPFRYLTNHHNQPRTQAIVPL